MTNFENWKNPLGLNEMRIEQNKTEEPIIMLTAEGQLYNNPYNYKVITSDGKGGGAVVLFPNDLAFHVVVKNTIIIDILKRLQHALNLINIHCDINGNDLLISNHKILGSTSRKYGEYMIEGFFISFDNDAKIINEITYKKSNKEPISASKFGITPDFILDFLYKIAKQYNFNIVDESIQDENTIESEKTNEYIEEPNIDDFENKEDYNLAKLKYEEFKHNSTT